MSGTRARVIALVLLAPLGSSAAADARALPAKVRATVDATVRRVMRYDQAPGALVGVWWRKGNYRRAYGRAQVGSGGAPMSTGLHVRIGSVTKTFTGTIVLQLVQEGKLHLSDKLSQYVAGMPNGNEVTIRQLLNHTSGEPICCNPFGATGNVPLRLSIAQVDAQIAGQPPLFAPGGGWTYSNANFILLGQVITKVTGHSLADEYARRILRPLGLRHTAYVPGGKLPSPHADGYLWSPPSAGGPNRRFDTSDWDFHWVNAAGAMVSTLDDLGRWGRALGRGTLLRPRTQRERLRTVATTIAGTRYGLGVARYIETIPGGRAADWIGHSGEVFGWNDIVLYSPRLDAVLVVLLTTSPTITQLSTGRDPVEVTALAGDIAREVFGD